MKRFPFLDWMRGLAVVIMIQCHTFNSFARTELQAGGPYVLSQFVGGMAAPLFLFMAGMTFGFQMDSLERRERLPLRRWLIALRHGGYILGVAFAFRIGNFLASLPRVDFQEVIKVDILNCMGVGLMALSVAAVLGAKGRVRFAIAAGLAIAAAAPLVANLPWEGVPVLLRQYLAAEPGQGRFAFFPCASYVGFGLAAGTIVKGTAAERFERLMQWVVAIGFALVFSAQYFSSIPASVYSKSNFWSDSPGLILIRVGVSLLLMAGSYL
ncbi:MAG TPA: heparan-alpha-glucosaminide N-acetyltransferase domain-containing protein, partial [Bryobacteraceae bacterium]